MKLLPTLPGEPRPWSIEPLLEVTGETLNGLGKAAGVSGTTASKWLANGLTTWQADRLAIRVGVMPGDVWPEWYAAGLEETAELELELELEEVAA